MKTLFAIFAAIFAGIGVVAAAEAVYTPLDLGRCEVEEVFEEGGGAVLRCAGLDGLPVFVSEGDLRFDVDFGASNGRFDTFAPFNSPGTRIEWRVEEGKPHAAILRFRIEPAGDILGKHQVGEVLAIFKVGSIVKPGCPVAYIDALLNRDANRMARQVADAFAPAFRCGEDRATYVGATGELSGSASTVALER